MRSEPAIYSNRNVNPDASGHEVIVAGPVDMSDADTCTIEFCPETGAFVNGVWTVEVSGSGSRWETIDATLITATTRAGPGVLRVKLSYAGQVILIRVRLTTREGSAGTCMVIFTLSKRGSGNVVAGNGGPGYAPTPGGSGGSGVGSGGSGGPDLIDVGSGSGKIAES